MEELRDAGVPGDVLVNSTLEGRMLEVVVEDLESLPGSFGVNVPEDMYVVVEGETSREGVTPIILSASVNTRIATRRTAIAFGSFAYRRGARCC